MQFARRRLRFRYQKRQRNRSVYDLAAGRQYTTDAADGISGSLILGREHQVGNGQLVLEGRVAIGRVAGQTDTLAALTLAYRHHFKLE